VDVESQLKHRLLWIPSTFPDLCERRLWDRFSAYSPTVCRTEQQAAEAIRKHGISVALAHGSANGLANSGDPAALLVALQTECPTLSFFLRDVHLPISKAVQLARRGAAGIFGEESDEAAVVNEVESALLRESSGKEFWRRGLVGSSEAVEWLRR